MTATRRSHYTSQTPVSSGAHAIPASPVETEHLSFEFWYTRIFGYYNYMDHVSIDNLSTGLRKVIIEYSESDPSVFEELLKTPFGWIENNIVAFYEPLSSTLVYKRQKYGASVGRAYGLVCGLQETSKFFSTPTGILDN
ncbi:hypothetical protein TWF481_008379 [Arthrobotrys musiformis]|uniref:Uncharacterized protein n=1 Tax=Arthrobotrys musiformis TaxID=47236 RepID=A0AAV9W6X7_9PEZI